MEDCLYALLSYLEVCQRTQGEQYLWFSYKYKGMKTISCRGVLIWEFDSTDTNYIFAKIYWYRSLIWCWSCTCQALLADINHAYIYRTAGNLDGGKFWRILTLQIFNGKYFDGWSLSFTKHCIDLKIWRVKFWQSGWKASKTSIFPPVKISRYTVASDYIMLLNCYM